MQARPSFVPIVTAASLPQPRPVRRSFLQTSLRPHPNASFVQHTPSLARSNAAEETPRSAFVPIRVESSSVSGAAAGTAASEMPAGEQPTPQPIMRTFPEPAYQLYQPMQSSVGKKIWAGCRTAALPNDSGKPYGHYTDGRDKLRAVFRDSGKALTPEIEASIKAIPETNASWRVSDCSDYCEHQGKFVVSDVVLSLGIVDDKRNFIKFNERHLTKALYPSLGEVPSGNSSVSVFRIFVYAPHSSTVLIWPISGTKTRSYFV